jgi:hypothetical protein
VSFEGGIRPVWDCHGRASFFRSGDRVMAADIVPGPRFSVRPARELLRGRHAEAYDVAPDGRFLTIRNPSRRGPSRLRLVLNWFEEVRFGRGRPLTEGPRVISCAPVLNSDS